MFSYYMEKAMAPHSSTLAWKIPWMEKSGGLQPMGSLRVGHHWATSLPFSYYMGFPCGSAGKESTRNAGDLGSIPGFGRSPGEGKGYPLQCSGLGNSMDCIVHGVAKGWIRLSYFQFHFSYYIYIYIHIHIYCYIYIPPSLLNFQ